MDNTLFFLGVAVALYALYRLLSRRMTTPEARVRALLRRHHALQRLGLPERDSLYRLLTSRNRWRNLPPAFIAELVTRLQSKENVLRFVSLAEDHRFHIQQLPTIAAQQNRETAMREVALWLAGFGKRLHSEERYKEAEFVQRLALQLLPQAGFTLLPLAATLFKMERYVDAAPLFREGLEQFDDTAAPAVMDSRGVYEAMHAACKTTRPEERHFTQR